MKTVLEIHPIQAKVVNELMFRTKRRFSELNTAHLPTDHFNFHLQALVVSGLVFKDAAGWYSLTTVGKEFAGRMDDVSEKIEKQAKFSVVIRCAMKDKGVKKHLLQERLKQPYYGYVGPPSGKVRWGETAEDAAKREFKKTFTGGRNGWYTLEEIALLPKVFDDFDRTMAAADQTALTFTENKYTVAGF